jgi:hypothetical protein
MLRSLFIASLVACMPLAGVTLALASDHDRLRDIAPVSAADLAAVQGTLMARLDRRPMPRPAFRPGGGNRPGFNRPARPGGVAGGAIVRPDGSSVVIRPPKRPVRPIPPPIINRPIIVRPLPPRWRPWRPGLNWVVAQSVSYEIARSLNWCHYHAWDPPNMTFHSSVRCEKHNRWNHPSIRYVYVP